MPSRARWPCTSADAAAMRLRGVSGRLALTGRARSWTVSVHDLEVQADVA